MAIQTDGDLKTFTAGEALAAWRRVKLSSSSGTQVEYADQTDSDGFIGVTQAPAANGDPVTVGLAHSGRTFKCTAADTFAVGATLYAADDGKVSDVSSGNAIATALEASTTGDGDVVEVKLDFGAAGAPSPSGLANHDATDGAVPFVVKKAVTGASTTAIWSAAVPRKLQIIKAWSVGKSADGGTWKLNDGTNDITDNVTQAASDTDIDNASEIDDAYATLDAGDTLSIVHTGASLSCEVYVMCLPVS